MKLKLSLLLLLFCIPALCQILPPYNAVPKVGVLPASCVIGDLVYLTTGTVGLYACSATNTWTAVGSGGSSTVRYMIEGTQQGGACSWPMNYVALANTTYGTADATHQTCTIVIAANTATGQLWITRPVTSAVTSISLGVEALSTDTTHAASFALSYACVVAGADEQNPTPTTLTALTPTLAATWATYATTRTISCTGTATAPAYLRLYITPTAPSGAAMSLERFWLSY